MIEDFFDMSEAFPLAFDEDRHLYYLRGDIVPSVTQILREISGFPETEEGFVSEAAEFGTEVHKAIAATLEKKKIVRIDPRIPPYVKAAKKFIKDYHLTSCKVYPEQKGWHEYLRYAGTLDVVFEDKKGNIYLVDWKTGSYRPGYPLQLAGYAALIGKAKVQCYCVMLDADGSYAVKGGFMYDPQHEYYREFMIELSHFNLIKKYRRGA